MQISIKVQLQFVLEYVMEPMIMTILWSGAHYALCRHFLMYHYYLMWAANFPFIRAMAKQKTKCNFIQSTCSVYCIHSESQWVQNYHSHP